MKCTGQNCPLNLGNVEKCTAHNCEHRTKHKTNYDNITSSVERLANMLVQMSLNCDFIPCYYAPDGKVFAMDKEGAIQYTIEWLQKECDE
jgi:hypothetical protein